MRVIVADDHGLIRDILKQCVLQLIADAHVDEADSFEQVVALAEGPLSVDLLLLDLGMPGMDGAHSVQSLRDRLPESRIVVVSAHTDPTLIRTVMGQGANGYIPKSVRGRSLVTALKLVLAGETYLPPSLIEGGSGTPPRFSDSSHTLPGGNPGFAKLTTREAAVLRLLIEGKSNKVIGLELGLQEVTVKVHLRNVYRKLQATNRTDAVRIALRQGWS